MDSDRPPFWLADDHNDEAAPQAAALGASSNPHRPVVEMIDFFSADEKKRTPARAPPPPPPPPPSDHRDLFKAPGYEKITLDITLASAPTTHDERYKEELAAAKAEVRRAYNDNQRLRSILHKIRGTYDAGRHSRPFASSKQHNGLVVPRPLLLDLRPSPDDDVTDSFNSAAMRGHSKVVPVDDGGSLKTTRGKEVMVDEASNVSEETIEDDDPHLGRNSNKKLKLSSPPPEKDEKAAAKRKARVIVRFRTETDDINGTVKIDGCLWRKYGKKMPAASPKTPRCYYKCNMAKDCPVRKHLQKCSEDESIVNVTYEGDHSHPLPQAALPMVRATAAALRMVMSGSMPYGEALMDTSALAATISPGARAPCTATVSISSPFPTALLDLSKSPEPALFQGQPAAACPGLAAPGGRSQLPQVLGQVLQNQTAAIPELQMSSQMLAAAFAAFIRFNGGGGAGGNGGAH